MPKKSDFGLEPVDPCYLEFRNIRLEVPISVEGWKGKLVPCLRKSEIVQKTILNGISGVAPPGRLIALMGASGAGKSTLLNILASRFKPTSGFVKANGHKLMMDGIEGQATVDFLKISSFVQQEDIFFGHLTVEEHLYYQSQFKLSNLTAAEKTERIERLIAKLGLEKCRKSFIGNLQDGTGGRGISGGERKRLSIASELLTNPSVIFLDEPTSGLDSFMSTHVCELLRELAHSGRTIICTIHQPSSQVFTFFDDLILLSDGCVVYNGPRTEEHWAIRFPSLLTHLNSISIFSPNGGEIRRPTFSSLY